VVALLKFLILLSFLFPAVILWIRPEAISICTWFIPVLPCLHSIVFYVFSRYPECLLFHVGLVLELLFLFSHKPPAFFAKHCRSDLPPPWLPSVPDRNCTVPVLSFRRLPTFSISLKLGMVTQSFAPVLNSIIILPSPGFWFVDRTHHLVYYCSSFSDRLRIS